MAQPKTTSRGVLAALVIILLLAAGIRIVETSTGSFMVDEYYTFRRAHGTLDARLTDIGEPGNQVPLYFLSVSLLPHDNEFGLRTLGVFFGLIWIALLMKVIQMLYQDDTMALLAALMVSVAPVIVEYSRTARPHPLVMVFGLLASLWFFKLLRRPTNARWVAFTILSMAAYLSHYATAALPLSQFILMIWVHPVSRRFWRNWFAANAIAALPILPWVLLYARPEGQPVEWINTPNIFRPYLTITNIIIRYEAKPTWYFAIALLVLTPGLFIGARNAYREARQHPFTAYWLILGFVPMLLVLLISQVKPIYVERYFLVTAPALFILMFLGWKRLSQQLMMFGTGKTRQETDQDGRRIPRPYTESAWQRSRGGLQHYSPKPPFQRHWVRLLFANLMPIAAIILTIIGFGITAYNIIDHDFVPRDWRGSVAYVEERLEDGDGLINDAFFPRVFNFYYDAGPDEWVLSEEAMKALYADELAWSDLPFERLWLFVEREDTTRDQWLRDDVAVLDRVEFHRITVYLVAPLPDATAQD